MNILSHAKRALVVFFRWSRFHNLPLLGAQTFRRGEDTDFRLRSKTSNRVGVRKKIAQFADVPHEVLSVGTFAELGGNALTGDEEVEAHQENIIDKDLPNTFVPGRNIILLSFAAARAWQLGIENIVTGVCQTDYSGYPDCRKNTIEALQLALNLGMEKQFVLHTPLMWLTKAQTVRKAQELEALEALSFSHTCYNGTFPPCGTCPACHLRQKGFSEAGIIDPLIKRAEEVN